MLRKSQLLDIDLLDCKTVEPPSDGIKPRQQAIFVRFEERSQLQYDAEYFIHHSSMADLERVAEAGCHLCSLAISCWWKPFPGKTSKYSSEFSRSFLAEKFSDKSSEAPDFGQDNVDVTTKSERDVANKPRDIQCAIYRQKGSMLYSIGYVDNQTDIEADGPSVSLQGEWFLIWPIPEGYAQTDT